MVYIHNNNKVIDTYILYIIMENRKNKLRFFYKDGDQKSINFAISQCCDVPTIG